MKLIVECKLTHFSGKIKTLNIRYAKEAKRVTNSQALARES